MDDVLISRDSAIRLAEQGQVQGFEWQIHELLKLPVTQKFEWVLCSERLPDKNGKYLVSRKKGPVIVMEFVKYSHNELAIEMNMWMTGGKAEPVAWMLLPEPLI